MIIHYYTLRRIVSELDALLSGARVNSVYSQSKNELRIGLSAADRELTLVISIQPGGNVIYCSDTVTRARRNSVDLFPEAVGQTLISIAMHAADRAVLMKLENGLHIAACLYNTASGNIYVTDSHLAVRAAFKHGKSVAHTSLALRDASDARRPESAPEFIRRIRTFSSKTVLDAIRSLDPLLGTPYSREVLYRSSISQDTRTAELEDARLDALYAELASVVAEMSHSKPRVYAHGNEESIVSIARLSHLVDWTCTEFESLNDAMKGGKAKDAAADSFASQKNAMMTQLRKQIDHLRKTIGALEKQSEESKRAEEYTRKGNLIVANLTRIRRGLKNIDLQDLYNPKEIITVQLSPSLGPNANAEYYFTRARKAREGGAEAKRLLVERNDELGRLTKKLEEVELARTEQDLKQMKKQDGGGRTPVRSGTPAEDARVPFRIFRVVGGYEVWVGKNSQNNDELTAQHARPHDLWFHARGAGGSHVVLRVPAKNQNVPKESIVAAASIAAYYSKMRKAKHVAVAYCEKKYVRKPRKAPAGTVMLDRESVILVDPKLP